MFSFLTEHKDAFAAIGGIGELLQSLVTMAAVIVGGTWALHRFRRERPHEANVKLRMEADISEFDEDRRLLRIKIELENAGIAEIKLGNSLVGEASDMLFRTIGVTMRAIVDPQPVRRGRNAGATEASGGCCGSETGGAILVG